MLFLQIHSEIFKNLATPNLGFAPFDVPVKDIRLSKDNHPENNRVTKTSQIYFYDAFPAKNILVLMVQEFHTTCSQEKKTKDHVFVITIIYKVLSLYL